MMADNDTNCLKEYQLDLIKVSMVIGSKKDIHIWFTNDSNTGIHIWFKRLM
jgi:hypothetical protein